MRVTHVITRLIVGGAQENTVATVLGLQGRPDIDVDLIAGPTHGSEGSLESAFSRRPDSLIIVPSLVRPVQPWADLRALQQLTTIFQKTKPAIVHTHSGKAGILGRMAAKRACVPIIIHTIHGPSFGHFQNGLANCVFRSAEKYAARFTTHFISVANAMTQQYLAAGIGTPEQYTRIFSGFPLEPYLRAKNEPALRAQLGIAPDAFVVGKIARLFELKGHEHLFQAAPELLRRFPQIKFLLLGDGPLRARLQSEAKTRGLEKYFVFAGLIPPGEVPRFVGLMDVLVHLSRREGLPRALPQALAAGKPVVAFNCDGAGEVCISNETGFLLAADDTKGLVSSLTRLINDAELGRRLGATGRTLVQERFSVEQMVQHIYELYLKLASRRDAIGSAR